MRRLRLCRSMNLSDSVVDISFLSPSVSMAPGVIQLTRTLWPPISLAKERVNPIIAPFEAT